MGEEHEIKQEGKKKQYSSGEAVGWEGSQKKSKRKIHVILQWLIERNNSNRKINKAHDAE